jgi:hypothetical protein
MFNLIFARAEVAAHLPKYARWMLGETPLDFNFLNKSYDFRQLNESDIVGGPLPIEWSNHLVFGEYDFADGGGASPWVAVQKDHGSVWGLDIERTPETKVCFNSSINRFISTFQVLNKYLCSGKSLTKDLIQQVNDFDPDVFPASAWQEIIGMSIDG